MTHLDGYLFDLKSLPTKQPDFKIRCIKNRVWTSSKALLIKRYLKLFVAITKNCYYIDAFAGPQNKNYTTSWAAKLVMDNTPKWAFRKFALFELNKAKVVHLNKLKKEHENGKQRIIRVIQGDSNANLPAYLQENPIRPKEATFCLLDQRTNECDWATVEAVARHKKEGTKIEIFYFLPSSWFERFICALKKDKEVKLRRWYGRDDWHTFTQAKRQDRPKIIAQRMKDELGYKHVYHYAIYKDAKSSLIMFYMIHATDHDDAPDLMSRAYDGVETLGPVVSQEEMDWAKSLISKKPETNSDAPPQATNKTK